MTVKIGVLAVQGAVSEHVRALQESGAETAIVKRPEELVGLDGIVLPGGESTTMRRLMEKYGLIDTIRVFAEQGHPIFGTCAGLILMAKSIDGEPSPHLQLMDIDVKRNAFGKQVDSFEASLELKPFAEPYNGVFIRAPYINRVAKNVDVLATYEDHIVACRQDRFLVSAFHPELTTDWRLHRYFVEMVTEYR
ncbi:5'-phosphate synthase pdxT subunit [Sporolactobacillus spathodeae]|uniref:Pyridoxal 5'-phosphate synthase subunit PdxT n=1 Tax=Sporolactobacillus spathodeae TaxID=1465502 RepID=A0ABS2Q709_9BACL|nr:pyridoxal 5'-phosphate synthase glutaminase subunit PdxT [Sporolactobacillus spathodeae]MBM7656772.1 5'-phosphate synthase pdxT subunit [Sporolactobacillus spathodeae]